VEEEVIRPLRARAIVQQQAKREPRRRAIGRGSESPPPAGAGDERMTDEADKRGQLIRHLEDALALADEIEEGDTGFLIERALDEARHAEHRGRGNRIAMLFTAAVSPLLADFVAEIPRE
jgi:hypothetical protein